jgi:integrase
MATDRLTELAVKKAKPSERPFRVFDGGGMYLEVQPNGSRYWRHKYRFAGKEKLLSLGVYPDVSLMEARARRNAARKLLDDGVDPSAVRKAQRTAAIESFEAVVREWHATKSSGWSAGHAKRAMARLEQNVFPFLGSKHIDAITAPELLEVIRRIEKRGAVETAHTVKQLCGQVFKFGIATGKCKQNVAPDLSEAMTPVIVDHLAAVTEPAEIGTLMRAIAEYDGQPVTRGALQLSALLFQRPGNIRSAEWAHIDFEVALWKIPSADMKRKVQEKKSGRPHLVPLSTQAVALLRDLHEITGHGRYVFPSLLTGERCMSENTVNTALRRLGYDKTQMTAHGFRAMARTALSEQLNVSPDVIEAQLAHAKSGPLGAAYDRAEFMAQRRSMMQRWADYLDELRDGAKAVAPTKHAARKTGAADQENATHLKETMIDALTQRALDALQALRDDQSPANEAAMEAASKALTVANREMREQIKAMKAALSESAESERRRGDRRAL